MIQTNHMTPSTAPDRAAPGDALPSLGAGLDFTDPNSPLASYYMRNGHLALVAVFGMLFLILSYIPLWHTDIWGHLKFGEWMVTHRQLAQDAFSPFADPAAPSLHSYWLSQSGLYCVYHAGELLAGGDATQRMAGGVQLLRALHACLVAGRFLVLLLAMRRLTQSFGTASLGLIFVLVLGSGHIAIFRPQVFAEFFFACVLYALSRPVLSGRALLFLPLLLVLWANSHGSFSLGLILVGSWLVGQMISVTIRASPWTGDQNVRRLFLAFVLSTIAVAVLNPHGPFIFLNTLRMTENPNVFVMDEWQPIDFQKMGPALWIYLASLTVLVFSHALSKRWFSPGQLLLILGFGIQPLFHQRMLIWWLLLVPWLAAPHWATIVERLPKLWPFPKSTASFRKTLIAVMIGGVLLVWSAPAQWVINGAPAPLVQSLSKGTPWRLAAQLRNPDDPSAVSLPELQDALAAYGPEKRFRGCIFASETLGDYFLWTLSQDTPVFVYTHVHLFSAEHWQKCSCVKRGEVGWSNVLEGNDVNLIVVEGDLHPRLRAKVIQDEAWKVVLDESLSTDKRDTRTRLFAAIRKKPL